MAEGGGEVGELRPLPQRIPLTGRPGKGLDGRWAVRTRAAPFTLQPYRTDGPHRRGSITSNSGL